MMNTKNAWSFRSSVLVRTMVTLFVVSVLCSTSEAEEIKASDKTSNWPEFRGPYGNGHAAATEGIPVEWSERQNITWKTPIPFRGWSTPVVLDGQIWLTTATESGSDFYAIGIDVESGHIFYNERIFHCDDPEALGNNVNCYASPSPVIEPGRLYVHYGSYGTACIDTEALKVLWRRNDLECRHFRGPGSSAIVFEDLLILTFDGVDQQYLVGLDTDSGETRWKRERSTLWTDLDETGKPKLGGDLRKAFSTPLIVEVDGDPLMISVGSFAAFGYDPRSGREIWKIVSEGHTPSTRPVAMGDLVFVTTGYDVTELRAIRFDGKGDVSATHAVWAASGKNIPDTPSPIAVDGLVYTVSNRGAATCYEATTGAVVWSGRLGGSFVASPIYAGGHLFFSNVQGKTTVLRAGRSFEVLAENELDTGLMASPVATGRTLYLRTKTDLYRIDTMTQ